MAALEEQGGLLEGLQVPAVCQAPRGLAAMEETERGEPAAAVVVFPIIIRWQEKAVTEDLLQEVEAEAVQLFLVESGR